MWIARTDMVSGAVWRLAVTFMLLNLRFELTLANGADVTVEERYGQLTFKAPRDSTSNEVVLSNSRLALKLWKDGLRGGSLKSLVYKRDGIMEEGVELLQTESTSAVHKDERPGYWDMHWYDEVSHDSRGRLLNQNKKCSFEHSRGPVRKNLGENGMMLGTISEHANDSRRRLPVSTSVHYSMKDDLSGLYCTLLVEHGRTDPSILLTELRLVLRLNPKHFDYSFVADRRQRFMPTTRDIDRHASSRLLFKEARLLTKPENSSWVGEVDHKYMHSVETKDSVLYGWISTSLKVGIWVISPNKWEYLGGGPTKQELSIQTGPKLLAMLHSRHYGTPALDLQRGEQWQKVFGPFLIYVNTAGDVNDLIGDAKARAAAEVRAWPYDWVPFTEYKSQADRGTVVGHLAKPDALAADNDTTLSSAMWVGLIDERSQARNWEDEVKRYQFWNTTDDDGKFTIYNVLPGTYVLHTVVHGLLADTSVLQTVVVQENWVSDVGEIGVQASQKGSILWEIGYPDRSAGEYKIPLQYDRDTGKYTREDSFRQYGLWEKFDEMYPGKDPVFKVGESDWREDWFFAHVLRPNNRTTQRQISFTIDDPIVEGAYTLRLAIAGAHQAALEIRINDPAGPPLYDTGAFGKDNALARGGVHGHYYEFSISLSHMNFRVGENSIFLHQRKWESQFNYVMYDYLRMEAPVKSQ